MPRMKKWSIKNISCSPIIQWTNPGNYLRVLLLSSQSLNNTNSSPSLAFKAMYIPAPLGLTISCGCLKSEIWRDLQFKRVDEMCPTLVKPRNVKNQKLATFLAFPHNKSFLSLFCSSQPLTHLHPDLSTFG